MELPNFLLVGASKCGTTSIASHMAQHPQIYLSPLKEPKFLTAQFIPFPLQGPGDAFVESFTVKTFDEYQQLFRYVKDEKAVGEASVDNLYFHKKVIPVIKAYLGDVKIIIILRNPVDRAFSAYKNLVRDARETLSFEDALKEEQRRKQKGYEYLWRYLDAGFYYEQVRAYLNNFTHVMVLVLEHFVQSSFELFRHIFRFLGVDPCFTPKRQTRFNVSGRPKIGWIQRPFEPTPFKGKMYKYLAMNGFKIDKLMQWVEPLRGFNIQPIYLNPRIRRQLGEMYAGDVERLQKMLNVDLSAWPAANFDNPNMGN